MLVKAKFMVTKSSEMSYTAGRRWDIYKSIEVPKGTPSPEDGSVVEYDRTFQISLGVPAREITMMAVCNSKDDPENASFADSTPSGNLVFTLTNPTLAGEFQPGDEYYLTFERKEVPVKS